MSAPTRHNHVQAAYEAGLVSAQRSVAAAGVIAGLVGGLAMAVVGALLALATQVDIWFMPKAIAAVVMGRAAVANPGFDAAPVVVGTLIHFVVSALLGVIYALLMSRVLRVTTEYGAPVVGGLVYGALIWLVAYFIVVPLINPMLQEVYQPSFIIQNLVYGTVTGIAYMMARPEMYTYLLRTLRPAAAR
ncbi:MAG TPA: hypothetical protein VNL77_11665 [Roseiflexaceae bacterium]|nr:hypothetical protein [Roseiflexaceae bacterium]